MTSSFPPFHVGRSRDYYLTSPSPCPYLPGQRERKVFTFLGGEGASALNSPLSRRGFRRSQNIAYLPACDRCSACKPVRILTEGFDERPWRRVLRRNAGVECRLVPAQTTTEQFSVLRSYLDARHADGGMMHMTVLDYAQMVEQTPVDTRIHEYRGPDGDLLACALTDRVEDGYSMVYSFFDPTAKERSLGSYMILEHVRRAQAQGLPHIYLGYWVEGSPKMDYKRRFAPLETLTPRGWLPLK
jgi:arginine-tRNA-protein transferase